MKKIVIAIALASVLFLSACSEKGVTLTFSASDPTSRSVTIDAVNNIVLDRFILSIREVEFKVSESDPSESADIYFQGPFVLNLLDSTGPLEQTIGTAEVPAGTYEAVRFKLHKTTDTTVDTEIFDRSIYLSGTIDGTPFVMWHDTSENLDVAEETGGVVVSDTGPLSLKIDFAVEKFLDQSANSADGGTAIDLTGTSDGDSDGTIEINPDTTEDGDFRTIADNLKTNIKLVADFL